MKKFLIFVFVIGIVSKLISGAAGVSSADFNVYTNIADRIELKLIDDSGANVPPSQSITYAEFEDLANDLSGKSVDISDTANQVHLGLLAYYANKDFTLTTTATPMTVNNSGAGHKINYTYSVGSVDGSSNGIATQVDKVENLSASVGKILDLWASIIVGDYNAAPSGNYQGTMTFNITAL